MDIKEFVAETLSQIVDGVVDAQQRTSEKKAAIVPYNKYDQKVCFDVAVTVVENKETTGKAGITVWSIGGGVSGKSETSRSTVSRIKFEIPIDLPKGSEPPPQSEPIARPSSPMRMG